MVNCAPMPGVKIGNPALSESDRSDSYVGAWRAYHKALAESGAFVGGRMLVGADHL